MSRQVAPYGSWPTPITSELVVRAAVGLGSIAIEGGSIWWSERRPEEGGRTTLLRDGVEVLPRASAPEQGWNVRTAVHEYGGGAWWVDRGTVWFTSWDDQRLYRMAPGEAPRPLTPTPDTPRALRYADGDVSPDGRSLVCVRERHLPDAEVINELIRMDAVRGGEPELFASGADFYSDPRYSPDGRSVAWLEWDHPHMPWDETRLMLDGQVLVAGRGESLSQPRWSPDGTLHFISDRSGWWNLYRWTADRGVEPVVQLEAEIGLPQWTFGESRYDFLPGGRIVFAAVRDQFDQLAIWDGRQVHSLSLPFSAMYALTADGEGVCFIGASPTAEPALVRVPIEGTRAGPVEEIRPPRDLGLAPGWFSVPRAIDVPSAGGRRAHELFYPPTSPTHEGPPGEKPPLLVLIHGGPTAAAVPVLQLSIQYWTSRGFAVADVNYGGSTGFGRAYRDLLRGNWGVVDVQDCEATARWLANQGLVAPHRMCIRGGSAGGYTTLAALAFGDTFAAGASHYGIADLEALAAETHKFESRYLDGLIAPYPEGRDIYRARSPIHHLERFNRPLAVFQGLDDAIVPPNQSERIVEALRSKGVPVAYVPFEGEQHGFRKAENIRRALDSELSFYAQIFGFELPRDEGIAPVQVENLGR